MDLPEVFDVKQTANFLRCSESYVKSEIQNGNLSAFKIGRKYLIKKRFILDYLENNKTCQDGTKGHNSGGTKGAKPSMSVGMSAANQKLNRLEQTIRRKQNATLATSSSTGETQSKVAHLLQSKG